MPDKTNPDAELQPDAEIVPFPRAPRDQADDAGEKTPIPSVDDVEEKAGMADDADAKTHHSSVDDEREKAKADDDDEWDAGAAQAAAADDDEPPTKQADILIGYVDKQNLFRDEDGVAFADIVVAGHRETHPVKSTTFKHWLVRRYYDEVGGTPAAASLTGAIGTIEALACFSGVVRPVSVRTAFVGSDHIYIDLGDPAWQVIEITPSGWRIIAPPQSVRFRRGQNIKPLPIPQPGGTLSQLRDLFNFDTDADFRLAVCWMLAALRGRGPYPPLVFDGEQGTAKSSTATALRSLIDPAAAPLRGLPASDRDLFIAASTSHVLALDNLSYLPSSMSDAICRLATGGAYATRSLYSDDREQIFDFTRPVIIAGIEKVVTRGDLGDRSIFLTLCQIAENTRLTEDEFKQKVETERPQLLGFLLDVLSAGLKHLPTIKAELKSLPRMAGFALWIAACERGLEGMALNVMGIPSWGRGDALADYAENRQGAAGFMLDADPVGRTVLLLPTRSEIDKGTDPKQGGKPEDGKPEGGLCLGWSLTPKDGDLMWSGTATTLLGELEILATDRDRRSKVWPGAPNALSGKLRRSAPTLRGKGVFIELDAREGQDRTRLIRIVFSKNVVDVAKSSSASFAASTSSF